MFDRFIELSKKTLVMVVIVMLIVVITFIFIAMLASIYNLIFITPYVFEKSDFLNIFGWLLLVIIGLELLDAIYVIIKQHKFNVEIVLLVAVTAVARELIVYDFEKASGIVLVGIALVMAGIATAYYLITKTRALKGAEDRVAPDPPAPEP